MNDYAQYIAEHLSKNLNYSEYISESLSLDKCNISYAEYLATLLDPNYEAKKLRNLRKIKLEKIFNEHK